MSKCKAELEVGMRAVEECYRKFQNLSDAKICERIGLNATNFYAWKQGQTPGGFSLQRMCYAGLDVKYILTGKKERKNGKKSN